ncbi:hypothetical protein YTPLAS73_14520 [Nitrosarchaeum sp.]|nr:hypothetical protein YTPLAS73_14520 [Nitrosarchaeum sp.]
MSQIIPQVKKIICEMADANGYSLRDAPIQGDDFRLFLTPPGGNAETVEVFKEKNSDVVCCGAGLVMGGKYRKKFFEQTSSKRQNLKEQLEGLDTVASLDFFQIEYDEKNFVVTMRCELSPDGDIEEGFENCMNRINLAGYSVEDEWDKFFEEL